jgi:REP element-mobilizing transposase RayT
MARHLRHDVRGGWYHITTRGTERRDIFLDRRDRERFLELLEGVVERYGVMLHAYVLMDNHYHLLIETPAGNASRALQWLNVSYAVWHNLRHGRSGSLFQARFKSIPVEGSGSWALVCSLYIHLNPVRIQALGLGKEARALEKAGGLPQEPIREQVRDRLGVLRGHRWSSYPAYAGYALAPEWLTRAAILSRVAVTGKDATAEYRKQIEDYLKQGIEDGVSARLTQAVAIGSTVFIEKLRRRVSSRSGAGTNARAWRRLLPFSEIVRVVAAIKKEPWEAFADRRGDWGRDLALQIGRKHAGMTLRELGKECGMNALAVSKAVTRLDERLKTDKGLQRALQGAQRMLNGRDGKA